jgi:catechol 2,3-dioxygenase-like lactoylglutathione lyase family enzyme
VTSTAAPRTAEDVAVLPRITAVSHVSIQVTDMARSLAFYQSLFGLAVSVDREETFRALDADGSVQTFTRHAVYLRWEDRPGASFIVLGEHQGRTPEGRPAKLQQLGIDHVGFYVDDVAAIFERARALGATLITPAAKEGEGPAYGHPGDATIRTALFHDPDGTVIQVDQWL